ncbi:MAG: response regulator [Bacteroidia bacterium]|nr:response regulator [Bacteroidia bacterium]
MEIKHALLIDDNEIDNYIAKHIITKSNMAEKITVKTSANDALQYLAALKTNPSEFPDIIFLDIRMPEMDGFGFLDEFKNFPQAINNQCAVVMLTSSSHQKDIDHASQYSVVIKYLNKPLDQVMLENISYPPFVEIQ